MTVEHTLWIDIYFKLKLLSKKSQLEIKEKIIALIELENNKTMEKNILLIDIYNKLKLLPKNFELDVKQRIKSLINLKKDIKNKQLIEIPALYLKSSDLIFDYLNKNVKKICSIKYKDEVNILVSYKNNKTCDNFNKFRNVTILVDNENINSINNRKTLELMDY